MWTKIHDASSAPGYLRCCIAATTAGTLSSQADVLNRPLVDRRLHLDAACLYVDSYPHATRQR